MSIPSWIMKPIIKEVVKTAMKEFFDNYATKTLAFLGVVFVGVAWLMGKCEMQQFVEIAIGGTAALGVRSGLQAIGAAKANHSQEVKP